jgi:putative ABC transport system permease protein
MFDVPFLYGTGWPAQLDQGAEPVIVISRELNEKLFGGATAWDGLCAGTTAIFASMGS